MESEERRTGRVERRRTWWLLFIALLYVLSLDFWNWDDNVRIWGFPRFILDIFLIQVLLTLSWYVFVRYLWPDSRSASRAREENSE